MNNRNSKSGNTRVIEKTLESISVKREAPKGVLVVLLLLYVAASICTSLTAGSKEVLMIGDNALPVTILTGVFSSLANICAILLAVYCGQLGFITSFTILSLQIPLILIGVFARHNITSIPGVFVNILTLVGVIVIHANNVKVEKYQTRLKSQAVTDQLTGLPNRFACSELVNKLTRERKKYVAVAIDINNFKGVNSTMGFDTGNKALIELAERWSKIADSRASGTLDFICRFSGDEFALVIREYDNLTTAVRTIHMYEEALNRQFSIDGCDFYLTASFGYSEFPNDTEDLDTLFKNASTAMEEVKRANSSTHVLRFDPNMVSGEKTIEYEAMIRNAIKHDRFFFMLQPQYDIHHKLRGFEALARLKDDNGGMVSPGLFIPVAEKVGLIDQLDSLIFSKSVSFFGELLKKIDSDLTLSVNISVRHMMKTDFLDELRNLIEKSGVSPERIEIEITESIMIDSTEKALKCIDSIREMGFKVAIDDFGTGYSSLSYLNSFPANLLKIDKSFIDNICSGESSKQYVEAIISIGHIMKFDVIAEGVEKSDQLNILEEIGCDYIQGFIWGRPLPPEEAEKIALEQFSKNSI